MKKKRTMLSFPRGSMAKILLKMKLLTDQFNYRVGGIKSFLLSFIHGNGNTTTPLTARRVI
ncbi:MAG: hypothetical protein HN955_08960 [Prolixibacteraceae bacterium]|nr:hypothetical protein [Prolixibacteraceae bacterium]MBT6998566.1 hypothetical protein [Prolixibacteraceae bacterium]